MGINDKFWMHKAYEMALRAKALGEVPVGALLVDEHNHFLAANHNRNISMHDPSAHAEILVLREAGQILGNHRLLNTTLYVTLEPCPMCAAALVHARVRRVVFATRDFKTGAAGSVCNLVSGDAGNHQVMIDEGMMQRECEALLKNFFKTLKLNASL